MDSAGGAVELKAPDERVEEAGARQPFATRELAGPATFADDEQATNEQTIFQERKEQTLDGDEAAKAGSQSVTPAPEVSGAGEKTHATAYSLTLRGRTDAAFDGGSFKTIGVRTTRGTGCAGCDAGECVHVTGTLVSTFSVTTNVTLPSVNDFPDLTACQRQRVRDAITNILAPHEQRHVAAFRTYNGTVRRRFDLTICRGDFDAAIQNLHNATESARKAAAQAHSDALDPFSFDVDLDCEDRPAPKRRAGAGAQAPDAGEISSETEVA